MTTGCAAVGGFFLDQCLAFLVGFGALICRPGVRPGEADDGVVRGRSSLFGRGQFIIKSYELKE
jgi:predicted esterase YcpF (UPF0227 family)